MAGRSMSWINERVKSGKIKSVTKDGTIYVDERSLLGYLAMVGGPSLEDEADELEARGLHQEALWKRQEAQQQHNAWEARNFGIVSQPSEPVTRDAEDLGLSFIRKYGGS